MIWKIILPSNKSYTLPVAPKTYYDLLDMVNKRFDANINGPFVLKYLDSEDDLINLTTPDDFDTAVIIEKREKLHTIQVHVTPCKSNDAALHRRIESESTDNSTKETNESVTTENHTFKRKGSRRIQTLTPRPIYEDSDKMGSQKRNSVPPKSRKLTGRKTSKPFNLPTEEMNKHFRGLNEPFTRGVFKMNDVTDKSIDEKIDQKLEETEGLASIVFNVIRKVYGEEALLSASQKALKKIDKLPTVCDECQRTSKHMRSVCSSCFTKAFPNKLKTAENSPRYLGINKSPCKTANFHEKVETCTARTRRNTYPGFSYVCARRGYTHSNTQAYKVRLTRPQLDDTLEVNCGDVYHFSFDLQNNGEVKWPEDVRLVCINGNNKGKIEKIPSLESGQKHEVNLSFKASKTPGKYLSQWRISYGDGENQKSFGESLFEEIYVRKGKKCQQTNSQLQENTLTKAASQSSVEGRQEQDLDTSSERKDSGTSDELNGREIFNNDEAQSFDRIRCHEDRLKWARFLNDIFPGDLDEKIDFMYGCTEHASIHDVVENYLIKLGKSKCQEKRILV